MSPKPKLPLCVKKLCRGALTLPLDSLCSEVLGIYYDTPTKQIVLGLWNPGLVPIVPLVKWHRDKWDLLRREFYPVLIEALSVRKLEMSPGDIEWNRRTEERLHQLKEFFCSRNTTQSEE